MCPKRQGAKKRSKGKRPPTDEHRPCEPSPGSGDGYVASQEGELLARVLDRAARVPWEVVPADNELNRARGYWVSDEDLDDARQLLAGMVDALETGGRVELARLGEAKRHLLGLPETKPDACSRYVEAIRDYAKKVRSNALAPGTPFRDDGQLGYFLRMWRDRLASVFDPAFRNLDVEQMKTVLESIVDMDTKKGGARRWGAVHAAATLAVEVNAFGFGEGERAPEESEDVHKARKVARAAKRLRVEVSRRSSRKGK